MRTGSSSRSPLSIAFSNQIADRVAVVAGEQGVSLGPLPEARPDVLEDE
jgi:hypothetical protein